MNIVLVTGGFDPLHKLGVLLFGVLRVCVLVLVGCGLCVCGSGEPKEANESDANESAKYGLCKRAA
jgi:hypothetical protein